MYISPRGRIWFTNLTGRWLFSCSTRIYLLSGLVVLLTYKRVLSDARTRFIAISSPLIVRWLFETYTSDGKFTQVTRQFLTIIVTCQKLSRGDVSSPAFGRAMVAKSRLGGDTRLWFRPETSRAYAKLRSASRKGRSSNEWIEAS